MCSGVQLLCISFLVRSQSKIGIAGRDKLRIREKEALLEFIAWRYDAYGRSLCFTLQLSSWAPLKELWAVLFLAVISSFKVTLLDNEFDFHEKREVKRPCI
uniref:Uncharacterized protein n=1 Tax=Oryza sativa subsp. japonica TaxID=39947 RepID=Q6Z344_ORYSJ|nr:hypothetical protein [Oryza sativa Japonica Group]